MSFKEKFSFAERSAESTRVIEKYSSRVPVILESDGVEGIELPKSKYLIPSNMTASEFIFSIRKRAELKPEDAIYLFVNKTLVTSHHTMNEVYNLHKDADGFLYCRVLREATFG